MPLDEAFESTQELVVVSMPQSCEAPVDESSLFHDGVAKTAMCRVDGKHTVTMSEYYFHRELLETRIPDYSIQRRNLLISSLTPWPLFKAQPQTPRPFTHKLSRVIEETCVECSD